MEDQTELRTNNYNGFWGFLAGTLVGGLVGAATMLLVAPQSGKRTRAKIQQKGGELSERMTNAVDDAMAQTRHKARKVQASAQHQAKAMQKRGQAVLDDQKERLTNLVDASKTAVQDILS